MIELKGYERPLKGDLIYDKVVRYATDILVELDDNYRDYDIDLYLGFKNGKHYISEERI